MSWFARRPFWSRFWSRPIMLKLVHAMPGLWMAWAVTTPGALYLVPYLPDAVLVAALVAAPVVALILATFFAMLAASVHEEQMCGLCAANIMGTNRLVPFLLWVHHREFIGALAILSIGLWRIFFYAGPMWLKTGVDVVVCLVIALMIQASFVHRPRVPWCKYCRGWWENDPGAEPETVPDPTPPGKPVNA